MTDGWMNLGAALVLGMAWIAVTLINRRCRHEWENVGDPSHADEYRWQAGYRSLVDYRSQQVRCAKCGTNTAHKLN